MELGVQTCSLIKRLRTIKKPSDDYVETLDRFTPGPFSVFPEELWIMILENVVLSSQRNRQNTFLAFPEFLWLFRKRFPELQLRQVSPRVFEFQPSENLPQIYNLTNRNWCSAVYNFLQQKYPINSTTFSGGGKFNQIVPQSEFYYWLTTASYSDLKTTVSFLETEEVQEFHQITKARFPLNKKLTTFLPPVELNLTHGDSTEFYEAWMEFFYEFGSAMQNVSIEMFFFDLLKHVPNVRTLCIEITEIDSNEPLIQEWKNSTEFPPLPHLQTLEIYPDLDNFLMKKMESAILQYFLNGGYLNKGNNGEIKTLKLIKFHPEYRYYRCVVEYELETKTNFSKNVSKFRQILNRKKRRSIHVHQVIHATRISDLFEWLIKRRHLAEELIIDDVERGYNMLCPQDQSIVPPMSCVKYLRISDRSVSGFEFLTALPSLEHLHVHCRESRAKKCFLENDVSLNPFAVQCLTTIVSHYLYRNKVPKDCNIWEKLPLLQSLTVEEEGILSKHFVRNYKRKLVIFKQSIQLVDLT